MKRHAVLLWSAMAIIALSFGFLGCPQTENQVPAADPIYGISLDREAYTVYVPSVGYKQPDYITVTITNTGNTKITNLKLELTGENADQFALYYAPIGSLDPAKSVKFDVEFPEDAPNAGIYKAEVLINGSQVEKKLPLELGVYHVNKDAGTIAIDSALLQAGNPEHSTALATVNPPVDKPWLSSDRKVAVIDPVNGALTAIGPGKTLIGYIENEDPLTMNGLEITVYRAIADLDLNYEPDENGVLTMANGETWDLANEDEILAEAAPGETLVFSLSPDTSKVISSIDRNTGSLTFIGSVGDSEDITVTAVITRVVPEGVLTTKRGVASFTAAIGTPPEATVVSAETPILENGYTFDILFTRNIAATDPATGFTVTVDDTEATISSAVIVLNGHEHKRITITLAEELTPTSVINVSYDASVGDLNSYTTPVKTFDMPVDNRLYVAPTAQSAVITKSGTTAVVTITFDMEVSVSSLAGFNITGSQTATTFTAISGNGTTALALTLNLKPSWDELTAIVVSYSRDTGNVAQKEDARRKAKDFNFTTVTQNGFDEITDSPPKVEKIEVDGTDPETSANKLTVTWNKPVTSGENGFTLSGSVTATQITGISVSGATMTLSLNNWPSNSESGKFMLTYNRDVGTVQDVDSNRALSFTQAVTFNNYDTSKENVDKQPPRIVSATVEHSTPTIMRVVFDEPVTMKTAASFEVKVNYQLRADWSATLTNNTAPFMDLGMHYSSINPTTDGVDHTTKTISNAVVVPGTNDTTWDLPLDKSAKYGEILRLSTTAEGAVEDKSTRVEGPNKLAKIPEFIVRNMVRRYDVKPTIENTAGLYRDGTKIELGTINPNELYAKSMDYILGTNYFKGNGGSAYTAANPPPPANFTIVLDSDQTSASKNPSSSDIPFNMVGYICQIIITTTGGSADRTITITGNGPAFNIRGGIHFIIDEHVIFTHDNSTPNSGTLLIVNDGGKLILDGGEIRDNIAEMNSNTKIVGGVLIGSGTRASYFIMNSGKVTGNYVKTNFTGSFDNDNGVSAGGIGVMQAAAFVMHGGEVSNNIFEQTSGTAVQHHRAGGLDALTRTITYHGKAAVFITGGEFKGNKVMGAGSVASAGGIVTNGTFQKVGGTIYGSETGDSTKDNTTSFTGGIVKAGAVVVVKNADANIAAANVFKRDTTAGPDRTLFISSYKTTQSNAANNSVPTWAESFWD